MKRVAFAGGTQSVTAIGVGCGGLGGTMRADVGRDAEATAAIRRAVDLGMTFIDTAEVYGEGHSEELVGRAVAGRRDEVFIATKASPENLRPADLKAAAERSLKRLGSDRIDLYYAHWPNPAVPTAETMGAMADLVREGKILHVGVSNFSLSELRAARDVLPTGGPTVVQGEYNLFDRTAETSLIPFCREHDMLFVGYSPLDQGHICGGPRRRALLEPIAARYDVSVATLALAWLIRRPGAAVIPKAARPEHVAANAAAGRLALSDEDAEEIARISGAGMIEVPVDRIRVATPEDAGRKVYRTLAEALANEHGFTPSPAELAREIADGDFLKSVRVRPSADADGRYDLIEGRIRYWAWVIAFDGRRDIPVLVRE